MDASIAARVETIPPEFLHSPEHPFTPCDFAEQVTPETLPFLFMRLVNESQTEDYQLRILEKAAKTLKRPLAELWREFRKHQKNAINEQRKFRFLSVSEVYSQSGSNDWLVKPYLDKCSLAMCYGQSGTFKSFLAIDMGLSIASGTNWHGNPVAPGTVFYICGEGQKGIARRLRAWELHHGICLDNVPFFVSNRPAQFLNEESAIAVVAAVDELRDQHGNPVLIIIDTLNRNFGPGDESNTSDMTIFVNTIDSLLRFPYACTTLIIHHTGHKEQHRARGAYALHAALDWEYVAIRHETILELINVKAKDVENLPSVYLKPEKIILDWLEDDRSAMTSLVLTSTTDKIKKNKPLTKMNKVAYDILLEGIKNNGGKSIHTDVWRTAAYQAGISKSDKPDTKQKAFARARDYLQKEGLVEVKDDCWRPTPDTGHTQDN
jgi:hypothetical protein